ncbi:MAG: histidine phosphotransferase family protein [Pseudomonadota bacterium]
MTQNARDISALLGSRICHDLISPLGAIGNGLELLSMSGVANAEMTLIAESVANANARVRFYRVAYGSASADHAMGRAEITGILDDINRGSRLSVSWKPEAACMRQDVKLAFLVIQCLETALPYGGQITVSHTEGVWRLHGSADKLKVDQDLWDLLAQNKPDVSISPSQVQFALVPEMVTALGRNLTLQMRDQDILVSY